jgi:hypothetical protein
MNQILDEWNKSIGVNHIISVTIDGKTVYYIISPEDQANGIIRDNFGGVLGTQNPDGKIAYTRNDPLEITTKEDQPATDPRKNVVIVDSCIKSVYMGDDAKIQKWLADLKKGL